MKLLNFYAANDELHLGRVDGARVCDLTLASGGDPGFNSLANWLRAENSARDRAAAFRVPSLPLAGLKLAPLVARDARVFCVGLNYADHAAENNLPPPPAPIFFAKLAATVIPHEVPIPLPRDSRQVDYEAELGVMIGRRADCVSSDQAGDCIAGYTVCNDVTARDFQVVDKQWFRGKNCNGFGPMGPWLVTADELRDAANLEIQLRLNGREMQHSNTRSLIFPPAALIAHLSQSLVLEPGDVISTGTPAGIGFHRNPQVFLQTGDEIEVEVAEIGVLRNRVGNRR